LNHLDYAETLETRAVRFGNTSAALARYGADLLGRAIGHEILEEAGTNAATRSTLRVGYGQVIAQCIDGPTRQIMAHLAVRDILGS
jgi:hypothetical protein